MEHNKLVYIASPYSGDVERNVAFAKAACRYAMNQGVTPIASHLLYPQMLDDSFTICQTFGKYPPLRSIFCQPVNGSITFI